MFKSIFKNLLVTYLLIFIVLIAALSLILSFLYSNYIFGEKRTSLENAAFKVNLVANDYSKGKIKIEELESSLDSMGFITDSKIYLVQLTAQALNSPQTLKLGEGLEETYLIDDLKKIIKGETVFRRNQYSNNFDTYVVFTGAPWKTDSNINGAILLFSPVSQVNENITRINLIIWLTSLLFVVLSSIIIYINSLRISRPVKEIERAAINLAAGESVEDISVASKDEIGKLSETFNYMKNKLVNTEKMRKEFIANVSHDMRTPLTSINGFIEGMLDGIVKPEDNKKYLTIIHNETERLMRLTSDVLQLAKLQSGSLAITKESMDAHEIVNSVFDSIRSIADEKRINFTLKCLENLILQADRDKLKQILINIIANAVQYSPEGGEICVAIENMKTKTRFAISDNGIGIPSEDLPFIFEKFYRVDKSRQGSKGGTGLGLNIVKSLIELHNGTIWATSKEGVGTTITFEIPYETE